eukprot:79055-Prorocentrum_lima.AAC.1
MALVRGCSQQFATLSLLDLASRSLHLVRCLGVRLSYGAQRLRALQYVERSRLWYWLHNSPQQCTYPHLPAA